MTVPPPVNRIYITWERLHRDTRTLAEKLRTAAGWKGIIAVTRGGLVPATIIARELDILIFETVVVAGYRAGDHTTQDEPKIVKYPANAGEGEGWLVIDDIAATGRTGQVLRRLLPKAHFATVYIKPAGKPSIDTFVTEVGEDTWIYLPWFDELSFMKPVAVVPPNENDNK